MNDFLNEWAKSLLDSMGGEAAPPPLHWKSVPVFQNRLYGVRHQEGTSLRSILSPLDCDLNKVVWITFSGQESAKESAGLNGFLVENSDVAIKLMEEMSSEASVFLIGPAHFFNDPKTTGQLEHIKMEILSSQLIRCPIFIYQTDIASKEEPFRADASWTHLLMYCERAFK